jgi:hypothetical protein
MKLPRSLCTGELLPTYYLQDFEKAVEEVFEEYQQQWEAAKRTGLLEDKEMFAVERMVKHLKEMLEVE